MDPLDILAKYGLHPPEDYAWFDRETFDEGKDYMDLFNWLVAITRGELRPRNRKFRSGYTGGGSLRKILLSLIADGRKK